MAAPLNIEVSELKFQIWWRFLAMNGHPHVHRHAYVPRQLQFPVQLA